MENILALREREVLFIVSMVGSSLFLVLQWRITSSEDIKEFLYGERLTEAGKIGHFLFTKYSSLIILGVFPFILFNALLPQYSLADYGVSLSSGSGLISFYWISVLAPVIIVLNWMVARRRKAFSDYPQLLVKEWDVKLIIIYSVAWCVYLFTYELLFRGLLLIPVVYSFGIWPSILINMAMCALFHTRKGIGNTIGSMLFCFVLCIATFQTGMIWVAFLMHVVLTLSHHFFALLFHPEMRMVKARNKL